MKNIHEKSVEYGSTREREDGTTENKMETRVPTIYEEYWTESGRGDGQGDLEYEDKSHISDPIS